MEMLFKISFIYVIYGLIIWKMKKFTLKKVYEESLIETDGRLRVNPPKYSNGILTKGQSWKNIFLFDYLATDYWKAVLKMEVESNESELGELLQKNNKYNLCLSVVLLLLICLITFLKYRYQQWETTIFNEVLFIFTGIRVVSRTLEIILSFISDILESKKSSTLDKADRLKLSIKSYLELIVLYACLYFLIDLPMVEKLNFVVFISLLGESFLTSLGNITLSDVNFSYVWDSTKAELVELDFRKYFMALQVLGGMTLTVFAIASYLGKEK